LLAQDTNRLLSAFPLCPFSPFLFLILIGCFATLDGMKVKSVTPMHHVTIVVSSASRTPPSGYRA
jgi:hypothetical protein